MVWGLRRSEKKNNEEWKKEAVLDANEVNGVCSATYPLFYDRLYDGLSVVNFRRKIPSEIK